ncbi:MAG: response regulator [Planctomycetes bacterium]|nr:response regulator [Planctomycetota bacterium]
MNDFQQEKPLVLIVDDEVKVLDEVSAALSASFNCRCCTTAEEAIETARTTPPDLILSDINLNGHSGLEMCERIKEDPALHDVPVMFLSGAQIPDIIRRSHAVGATYYLRKPFDTQVLLELVDKALWMPHLVRSHVNSPTAVGTEPPA